MIKFDNVAKQILRIIQLDGRVTNAELAERVGIAPASMSDRLCKLQRDGVIKGFGARLNPQKLGLKILVFVEVRLDKTTPQVFEKFARAVRNSPEVIECHMVAGGLDYLIKSRFADMDAYRSFLGDVLLTWPGVEETRTYVAMEEIKNDGPLQVNV
ncbi:Lrp/AsnC ligand binding domain-containing protein [Sulfitobacter sp. D7]|uniref:Lrp/AsnC ligand binding domain-containing protein n=1 Tax=Sulfitobacter sp. D7 TaxID=1968541 RepID=UPI000E77E629|nr:Lrp/AsnC ligand binding domain-containing protein [Sulfitobacter sp. D7]AYE88313.1 ArsR family transcriptional regulator [Sulfitobacter sp. D7]